MKIILVNCNTNKMRLYQKDKEGTETVLCVYKYNNIYNNNSNNNNNIQQILRLLFFFILRLKLTLKRI